MACYHYGFIGNNALQIARREDVKISGWMGVAADTTYGGKDLFVQGGEQAIAEQMNLVMTEGNYPSSAKEALIDMSALTQFGLSIGDTIDVNFNDGKTSQFLITGAFDNVSSLKGVDAHGLFLSVDGIRTVNSGNHQEYYYIQFANGVNIDRALSNIKKEYGIK